MSDIASGAASPFGDDKRRWLAFWPWHRQPPVPPPTLTGTLQDARQLLIYATETGVVIDPAVSQVIVEALHTEAPFGQQNAGAVLSAIAALAAKVSPVTANTLTACRTIARQEILRYTYVALMLAILIVPLSIGTFITSGLSTSVTADIQTANTLAVSLHADLDAATENGAGSSSKAIPSSDAVLTQLQQFASSVRSIHDDAGLLSLFLLRAAPAPLTLPVERYELDPNLRTTPSALLKAVDDTTGVYQSVRRYAKEVQGMVGLYFGAIGAFVLPMLYALLGACAYLLRTFSKELHSGSFSNRYDISARFFVAMIGGIIVGLFNNFTVTGATLSPLALAFLVGYAADVFFSFLEGLLTNFRKPV